MNVHFCFHCPLSIFVFVSFSAANGISFSSAFSFTAENEKCFSVGLEYTPQKDLSLGLVLRCKVLVLVLNNMLIPFCCPRQVEKWDDTKTRSRCNSTTGGLMEKFQWTKVIFSQWLNEWRRLSSDGRHIKNTVSWKSKRFMSINLFSVTPIIWVSPLEVFMNRKRDWR